MISEAYTAVSDLSPFKTITSCHIPSPRAAYEHFSDMIHSSTTILRRLPPITSSKAIPAAGSTKAKRQHLDAQAGLAASDLKHDTCLMEAGATSIPQAHWSTRAFFHSIKAKAHHYSVQGGVASEPPEQLLPALPQFKPLTSAQQEFKQSNQEPVLTKCILPACKLRSGGILRNTWKSSKGGMASVKPQGGTILPRSLPRLISSRN